MALAVDVWSFCIEWYGFAKGLFKVTKILDIVQYAANFSFTDNFTFAYTNCYHL